MKRTAIIMAGGSGERFWPLSRVKRPKQLLKLTNPDKIMLAEAIDRISPLIPNEDIYIITSAVLLEPIREALPQLPPQNVIAEPYKRNTAPCLALGAAYILAKYQGEYGGHEISIAVLTADQSISPESGFVSTVDAALTYVENNESLCTIGIVPSRPETGYGYIEVLDKFDYNSASYEIKPVVRFCEKPNVDLARQFVEMGNYLWNSGMFFWRADVFSGKMKKYLPEVGNQINEMINQYLGKTALNLSSPLEGICTIFESFPNISVDYGLMEKADSVVVAKAMFDWDDVGSWDSLNRFREIDDSGNVISGQTLLIDNKNSVILNEGSNRSMTIATLGLEDMVVVSCDDVIMICPKGRVQEVKKFVEELKKSGRAELV
ncbi:MAG: sugar phosphate nucleotidyltransferase [Candidatus Kapabacteria bacterium]|nr:sugar phosphate nucleotidyltransferase [Candidatus Kapabacteria bacterium]